MLSFQTIPSFHLAIPADDLSKMRLFYGGLLGCAEGRSAEKWIDYNFFGHQLSIHLKPDEVKKIDSNQVDGRNVPVRHFGVILEWNAWHVLAETLRSHAIEFIIDPYIRFKGEVGEQATMFFFDPSFNALEFKSFKDLSQIFAK
jgi:extradiol dioxygenase family protein